MNYEISTTTDPNRKLLNLSDIKSLKMSSKYVILWNLSITYAWKSIKELYKKQ